MKFFLISTLLVVLTISLSGCVAKEDKVNSEGRGALGQGSAQSIVNKQEFIEVSKETVNVELESSPEQESPLQVNFSETGNIINWDSSTESFVEDWVFIYDKPGTLVLNVKLVFNQNSVCDMGKGKELCDQSQFNNGDTVSVEGLQDEGGVTVMKLEKITAPQQ